MRIFFICFFFLFTFQSNAQDGFEAGLFMGVANYQGDLVDSYIEFKEINLAMGGSLGYAFNNNFAAKVLFRRGKLSGNDANSRDASRRARNLRFKSDLYEFALVGEWYFLGRDRFIFDDDARWLNPYCYIGMAAVHTKALAEGDGLPEKTDSQSLFLSIPVGGGIKFNVYDHVSLGIEAGFRPAFSDYLDGVSELGNPNRNDWYFVGGLHLAFLLGNTY